MIADEAAIGGNQPKDNSSSGSFLIGKKGDMLELEELLGSAPVMKVNKASSADFIARVAKFSSGSRFIKN